MFLFNISQYSHFFDSVLALILTDRKSLDFFGLKSVIKVNIRNFLIIIMTQYNCLRALKTKLSGIRKKRHTQSTKQYTNRQNNNNK